MAANNSKTNKTARRRVVLERLQNYLKTGVYAVTINGMSIAIPKKRIPKIKEEIEILQTRIGNAPKKFVSSN